MLTLISKTPVKFEFSDGVQVTTVTVAADEESEVIAAKLQRVLDLEAGQGLPVRQPGAARAAIETEFPELFDSAAAEAEALKRQKIGWEALSSDSVEDLPEA